MPPTANEMGYGEKKQRSRLCAQISACFRWGTRRSFFKKPFVLVHWAVLCLLWKGRFSTVTREEVTSEAEAT